MRKMFEQRHNKIICHWLSKHFHSWQLKWWSKKCVKLAICRFYNSFDAFVYLCYRKVNRTERDKTRCNIKQKCFIRLSEYEYILCSVLCILYKLQGKQQFPLNIFVYNIYRRMQYEKKAEPDHFPNIRHFINSFSCF